MRLFAAQSIIHPETGEILALQGARLTREHLISYQNAGISYVDTLTVLEPESEIPDSRVLEWLQIHRPEK